MAKAIDGKMLSWKNGRGVGEVSTFFGQDPVSDTLIVMGRNRSRIFLGDRIEKYGDEVACFIYKTKEAPFYEIKLYND